MNRNLYFLTPISTVYLMLIRCKNYLICKSIKSIVIFIRVMPLKTVDNNLGPDRLAGTKALDPNYCRQPTLWLDDLCLEVQTVHGTTCLGPRHSPYSYYQYRAYDIAAVGTTFNDFSYDVVWAEYWTHYLPDTKRLCNVLCNRGHS